MECIHLLFSPFIAGEDYIAVEESLNFRSGLLGICFYIRILTDGVDESNEDFNLTITADSSMNGVSVGEPSTVTVTIIDSMSYTFMILIIHRNK